MPQFEGAPAQRSEPDLAPVTSGLNLWLELEDPAKTGELLLKLLEQQPVIRKALTDLHYVHFARFLPTPDFRVLQVITEFDGDLQAYVLDFALAIGDQFEMILSYVKDWKPLHVKDHPAQFLDFILNRNLGYGKKSGGVNLFSAYPQRTVIDIIGASGVAPDVREPEPVEVDSLDVQANVLRGVGALHAWHVGVHFDSAESGQALLRDILSGDHGAPRLSNDAPWPKEKRPAYWLTLGLTYDGLLALGIGEQDRKAFETAHKAFVRGPGDAEIANRVGDVDDGRPAFWQLGGANALRMLLSLHADDKAELEKQSAALRGRLAAHGLQIVNRPWETDALLDETSSRRSGVHFGYVDGLSQPRPAITRVPHEPAAPQESPDLLPRANVGEFLLGAAYPNAFKGANSLGGLSPGLAQNASFAALRIMEQDVVAFDELLAKAAQRYGVSRDWIAARMMGRWPDGTPVSQSPDAPLPESSAPDRNGFDYLPSVRHPSVADDSAGLRCPLGAHVRRMNPRSARVAGVPHTRRLLRRGMPYGPAYVSGAPADGSARGLFGLFFCADLERQYEFLLHQWAQGDRATSGLAGQQDPIIGAQAALEKGRPMSGQFRIPMQDGRPDIVLELPRLVKTVGSAYLFVPGIEGVRHLASLAAPASTKDMPDPGAIDLRTFDPRAKAVRDDPFEAYAWFRDHQPVARLPLMNGTWVFSHRHVREVAQDNARFRKRRSTAQRPAGLLNMDAPAHTGCRAAIEPLFNQVLPEIAPGLRAMVARLYAGNCQGKGRDKPLDWIARFARPAAQAAFFELFGLPLQLAEPIVAQAERILALASPADDRRIEVEIDRKQQELATALQLLERHKIPGRLFDRVRQIQTHFDVASNKPVPSPPALKSVSGLEIEQLANSVTLAMAGFLPLQWFIALVTWRLLDDRGRLLQQLKDDPAIGNRQVVDELLRFDMSTPMSARYAAEDGIVLNGVTLAKDERVVIVWPSASRDKTAYGADADSIDLTRDKGPGWAFGAQGEHGCLGRDMVYALMEPVVETLRSATPAPVLAEGFAPAWGVPAEGAMFRSMAALMLHC